MMRAIIDFLENNVNGRTLHTKELAYDLENGAYKGIYSDQISFSNLKYSKTVLNFDMFIVANEKIFVSGQENLPEGLQRDVSAVSLFRYELAQRRSTGEITGLFRFISASGKEVYSEAIVSGISNVRIEGKMLKLFEDQALYRDQTALNGFKPVAFQAEHRFFLDGEKLHFEYDGESFDIDSATRRRKASADSFPAFISIEK